MSLFTFKFSCICLIILMLSVAPNMLFQGYASSETVTHKIGTSDFNFVVAGDFSCNKEAKKTVNNMATKKPEIVLTVGDHSYRKSADCWFDTVSPLDTDSKLKIAFGEHDIDDNLTKYKTYLRHFNLTDPYYSFDYRNVHFLAMATPKNMVIPYMSNSTQYNFVKNDLKSAHENKNVNWIVVLSYRPLYSSTSIHSGKAELQDLYHPLFDKYRVDLVLQGHNHNYQRTYPLGHNIADSHSPIILDNNASIYKNELNGPIFVTVGTAGEILHNFINQKPFVKTQFLRHGFLNLEVTNNGSNMTGTFYENNGLISEDQFTILKKDKIS
jgi:predicted phosphodiesterase